MSEEVIYQTDTLQKDGTRSKQFWRGEVIKTEEGYAHRTDSWSLKKNGEESKHRVSNPTYTEAKNVGQSNERTPIEQAISEIESKADKKKDKRYWPVGEEKPDFRVMPMSAKRYGKIEDDEFKPKRGPDKVDFPCVVQPKLDGIRMLFNGEEGWTRKLKDFEPHVTSLFEDVRLPDGVLLDGELMLPEAYTFQQTVSAVKREQGLSTKLQLHVFDMYDQNDPDEAFISRIDRLGSIIEVNSRRRRLPITVVPTQSAGSHEQVLDRHGRFVQEGYEGTMVRQAQGTYKDATTRSGDLLKLKGFIDEEFEITGVREGQGKFQGMAIMICETDEGQTFEVTPKGTEGAKAQMFEDRDEIVGKPLTVRYQNRSDDGIPRFPVGIAIRDYEG